MDLIERFKTEAKQARKKIVYPEGDDERILQAAQAVTEEGLAEAIVLGKAEEVEALAKQAGAKLDGVAVIDPKSSEALGRYAAEYNRRKPEVSEKVAARLLRRPLLFGAMMVSVDDADGVVGGVANATARVIEAGGLAIGYQPGLSGASSFFIMVVPECLGEKDKTLVFADCAVNVNPSAKDLAEIAVASGRSAKTLLGIEPKIAMLSFSTKGSASHSDADKVIEATKLAKEIAPDLAIDGEMQGDAALVERVAKKKVKESDVAGQANVLIFPDLDAGNIAYKLTQYLANASAYGPILQGFARPINDMSRGAAVDDLVAVTAITAVQAKQS
ncbi:MAG: phosphate acetyltransferase [Planctomycetes bacterium]|nr:phosphate acetyltransferase [Planctomycetota bacterium]